MPVDYDLVIIGGTAAACHAALVARNYKARVALVEPQSQSFCSGAEDYHQALLHVGRVAQQMCRVGQFGLGWQDTNIGQAAPNWDGVVQWAQGVAEILDEGRSLEILAARGVDVIVGDGEFHSQPQLSFVANGRRLRSRRYLIASGSQTVLPTIEGLAQAKPLTPESLCQSPLPSLPSHLIVIGGEPAGVELAQLFNRLGAQVTLIINDSYLFPQEDLEAARLIQTQLEGEGVRILANIDVPQVKRLGDKKWVQAGTQALEADEILLATEQQPKIDSLDLQSVGVKLTRRGIRVNAKLQTTNPHIYACGGAIGGYPLAHIARYEAEIAVKNALFLPLNRVEYECIPWAILTEPELARVGLTETQARRRFGNEVTVLRQYFKTLAKAQIMGETTGFCKLIVRRDGKILGAHVVGAGAAEIVGAIAIAMQQKKGIKTLAEIPLITPSFSAIAHEAASAWHQQKLSKNQFWQNLLENWFSSRRF